jgi:hypothetical protein
MRNKIDKVRAHREELKRLLFSIPTEGRKVTKTITVEMNKNKKYWIGYGYVSVDRDGPDGFFHFASHQEHPMEYALNTKEYKSGEYQLIVK